MKWVLTVAPLMLLAGCQSDERPLPAPTSWISDNRYVKLVAEQPNGSFHPTITLDCARRPARVLMFDFKQAPSNPPPLAGVMGAVVVPGKKQARQIEMAWGEKGQWGIRNDQSAEEQIAAWLLSDQAVQLTSQNPYIDRTYSPEWAIGSLGDRMREAKRLCGVSG